MNRLKLMVWLLGVASMFFLSSCEGDGPSGCGDNFNYAVELQAESTALSNAAQAYANDQSTANCEAYRTAVSNYLDAAEDLDNCVLTTQRDDYQAAIDAARDNLDALAC